MSDSERRTRRQVLTAAAGVSVVGVLGRVVAKREDPVQPSSASRSGSLARESNPSGGPTVEWSHKYYTEATNPTPEEQAQVLVKSVVSTSDGGFALAGNQVYGEGTDDFVLLKTDSAGTEQWLRTYDGGHRDRAESLLQASDGGYLLVGQYDQEHEQTPTDGTPYSQPADLPWAVRTDADGADQWRIEPGENEPGELIDCEQTTDGTFVAVGWVDDSSDQAAWLLQFDASGNVVLDQRYNSEDDGPNRTPTKGSEPSYRDRFRAVVETSDGDLLLGGAGNQGGWVLRTDPSGATQWQTHLGRQRATVDDLVETDDGNVLVTGRFYQEGDGDRIMTATSSGADLYLTLLDATGDVQWTNTYDGGYNEAGHALISTADGGYAAVGTSQEHRRQLFAVKTTGDGSERWSARYTDEESYDDVGKDLVQTADGGYAIAARDRFLKLHGGFTPTDTETPSETASPTATDTGTTETTSTSTDTATSSSGGDDDCTI